MYYLELHVHLLPAGPSLGPTNPLPLATTNSLAHQSWVKCVWLLPLLLEFKCHNLGQAIGDYSLYKTRK